MLSDILIRLRALFRRNAVESELDDELRFHFDQQVEKFVQSGVPLAEARRRARLMFGGSDQIKEECREARGVHFLETLAQDIRFAMRMLRKSPGFTAVAVLTLALGIGANTAIFSVVNAVLLEPLPYPDSERIVALDEDADSVLDRLGKSPSDPVGWIHEFKSLEVAAAYQPGNVNLGGGGPPESVPAAGVSSEFFRVLGIEPALGQDFPAKGVSRGVIVSWGVWQRHFSGDLHVIGKLATINAQPVPVLGVMPRGFQFPEGIEVWVPRGLGDDTIERGVIFNKFITRIRPGVTLAQANAEMLAVATRVRNKDADPKKLRSPGVSLIPLQESVNGDSRTLLWVLLGAVGFVLLIACVNVSNLAFARATNRQYEIAIRSALGAVRFRLIRQLLTENLILALFGGAFGILLAFWSLHFLAAILPVNLPRLNPIVIDGRVLTFTAVLSLGVSLLFGLAPSLRGTDADLVHSLKHGSSLFGRGGRGRIRRLLLVSEIALSFILLIGAGLMIRTLVGLLSIDPGFQTDRVSTVTISLPTAKYKGASEVIACFDRVLIRLRNSPGVEAAGAINYLPLGKTPFFAFPVSSESKPINPADPFESMASFFSVSGDYFQTLRIPLLRGRYFSSADNPNAENVAIVSESTARYLWVDQNPVGKQFRAIGKDYLVVGEVGNVHHASLKERSEMEVYVPHQQMPTSSMDLVVRTTKGSPLPAAVARSAAADVDKDQPISVIRTMRDVLKNSISSQRSQMFLLTSFGLLALVLAAIGCYGVVAYSVAQRTHEMGVRIALGATTGSLLRLIIGEVAKLAGMGVGLGVVVALGLTPLMASLLFGVKATDPLTFIGVAILLILTALLACYIPARRATKLDPMAALRHE